jgi:Fic family protein
MSAYPGRAGRYVRQPTGYRAFIPAPLPPDPPLAFDAELQAFLDRAEHAVAALDALAASVPSVDAFEPTFVRREALLSSRIEGSRGTIDDLLAYELDPTTPGLPDDMLEIANATRALTYGIARLESLPLSLRLLRELHAELMDGPHGEGKTPGEFRTTQNWIGPAGATLATASFVPPPPAEMWTALDAFERSLYADDALPPLVHAALAHAQFETIHPFLDGNGRVGRLLIVLLLCLRGVMRRPLLYLSQALYQRRPAYYDRFDAVRNGDWEGWLSFFLHAVVSAAHDATATLRAAAALREDHRASLAEHDDLRVLDLLYRRPLVDADRVAHELAIPSPQADVALRRMATLGVLEETPVERRYQYTAYVKLFRELEDLWIGLR